MSNFSGCLENLIFLLDAADSTGSLFSPVSILDLTSFVGDDESPMVTDFFFRLRPFLCGSGASWSESGAVTEVAAFLLPDSCAGMGFNSTPYIIHSTRAHCILCSIQGVSTYKIG